MTHLLLLEYYKSSKKKKLVYLNFNRGKLAIILKQKVKLW